MNSPDPNIKKTLKELITRTDYYIIGGAFVIILAIFLYTFFTPNYYKEKEPVIFEITPGSTLSYNIELLYKKGIIPNKTNMRIAAFLLNGGSNIKAGRYKIPNGMSYVSLLELFISGKREVPILVTFYEGINIYQIGHVLKEKLHADSAAVVALSKDRKFLDKLGVKAQTLEGYLLPDSYFFYDYTPPAEVILRLRAEFNRFFTDSLKQKLRKLDFNLHQVLTVASIVEGESNKISEYPVIAGVYYNRLKKGMKLQADPTVQYAYMGKWRRLYNKDLNINSPYNTYLHYGLPPGPINNPGRAAILAALAPARHNYIYFVADGLGGHRFSVNYSQHLKSVKDYRIWLGKKSTKN